MGCLGVCGGVVWWEMVLGGLVDGGEFGFWELVWDDGGCEGVWWLMVVGCGLVVVEGCGWRTVDGGKLMGIGIRMVVGGG